MTAEVAILNKTAVALAADSAVTIQYGDDIKIYNSLKLFNLCHANSVGIMIYHNAEFTSVPWETIIKQYRKDLDTRTFPTLEQYGDDFIAYLLRNCLLFPDDLQVAALRNTLTNYFIVLVKEIDRKIRAATRNDNIGATTIKRITREVINAWHEKLGALAFWASLSPGIDQRILQIYTDDLNRQIDRVFQPLPLTPSLRKRLRAIGAWLLTKDLRPLPQPFPQAYSGVVIALFGSIESITLSLTKPPNISLDSSGK